MTDATPSDVPVSPGEGRHLCGLLALTLTGDGDPPVSTGALADHLDVSAATVTETVKRFDGEGLVTYEPYVGAELTARGEDVARTLFWRRCIVQEFFETAADVSLDDGDAYRIGRIVSRDELARLGERLARPCEKRCEAADPADCDRLIG